ncbi:hypothetical protein [Halalkalicoccus salilacus]|uniref:hypothetical protein n=1 Tax=Halalkalicoccus sp. GCM10025704 TaxID=3252662 RepID=UPI0036114739
MLLPNCGAMMRPASISKPMLATPETNTAASGLVGRIRRRVLAVAIQRRMRRLAIKRCIRRRI